MEQVLRRVFYVGRYGLPVFAQRLAEAGNVRLDGMDADADPDDVHGILAQGHVYQVSSGMHEVPAPYCVRAPLLARTPALLLVSTIGAGYDTVDVAECTRRGIAVMNQAGGANAQAVVEHTLAMMLSLGKRMVEADRATRQVPNVVRGNYLGHNMHGKTLGLVGFGNVGRSLARLCSQGFGMRVRVFSQHATPEVIARHGAEACGLADLMRNSDYVAVCCALSPATQGLIGTREFALMPPHAYFVTTARAGIHDEAALTTALLERRIAGAGIDVWDVEPPPLDHPLLALDTVIATPHIAGATHESRIDASEGAARQILQALRGERPPRLLNPEVWPQYLRRLAETFPAQTPALRTAT